MSAVVGLKRSNMAGTLMRKKNNPLQPPSSTVIAFLLDAMIIKIEMKLDITIFLQKRLRHRDISGTVCIRP